MWDMFYGLFVQMCAFGWQYLIAGIQIPLDQTSKVLKVLEIAPVGKNYLALELVINL